MAWAIVQDPLKVSGAGLSSTILAGFNAGANATKGNLLIASVGWAGTATISSVTDDGAGTANSWNVVQANNGANGYGLVWCVNARDTLTLTGATVNFSAAATYRGTLPREYSGNHASPDDGNDIQSSSYTAGTDVIQSPYKTPTWNGDLIVGFGGTYSSPAFTVGTGFGNFRGETADSFCYLEDLIQTSAASVRAVFSTAAASGLYICGVAAFKASDGTPAGGGNASMWSFS